MRFDTNHEEEKEDYFDKIYEEPEKPKEPKKPALKPDDPKYWEEEESQWEHLKPRRRRALWLCVAAVGVIAGLLYAGWLRYFSPFVSEAHIVGYVEDIHRQGDIFKTYEGILLPYKELNDTTRTYTRDFGFTAADSHIAAQLKRMYYDNQPVRVEYKVYHTTLPWRGDSRVIVTAVDSVDVSKILPPEFAPKLNESR